jgi:hypothetical protein
VVSFRFVGTNQELIKPPSLPVEVHEIRECRLCLYVCYQDKKIRHLDNIQSLLYVSLDGPFCDRLHPTEKICDGVDSIYMAQNRNWSWVILNIRNSGRLL